MLLWVMNLGFAGGTGPVTTSTFGRARLIIIEGEL